MSESTLPYLKEIADSVKRLNSDGNRKQSEALQNINKTIGTYNVKNESLIIGGNENTEAIAEAVKTGLVEEVIEGEGSQAHPVEKSVFDIMKEAFVQVFREAMFSVVGEGSAAHEESIFQQIKDTLADIRTAQQTIATALAGSGGSGLSAQVTQIRDALIDTSDPNNPVNRIDNMATIVDNQGSDITAIKNAVTGNGTSYVENNGVILSGIKDALTMTYQNNTQMTNAELLNSINTFSSEIRNALIDDTHNMDAIQALEGIVSNTSNP